MFCIFAHRINNFKTKIVKMKENNRRPLKLKARGKKPLMSELLKDTVSTWNKHNRLT